VAWRGFSSPWVADFLLDNVAGAPYFDEAFVSTALDPSFAFEWAKRGGPRPVLLKVLVPHGSAAIYMEELAGPHNGNREKELLLRSGAAFRVRHAEVDADGVTRAVVELLDVGSAVSTRRV
jgi:hypothetical protein